MTGPKVSQQLAAVSADYVTMLTSPWMLAFGAGTNGLRVLDEIAAITNNYRHKVCWRTAAVVTDLPDAWNVSGNVRNQNGSNTEDFTPTAGKLWVQAGLQVSASSASGEAFASVQAATLGKGQLVASGSFGVEPALNSSQTAYFAVGEPFPVFGIGNLMFAVIINGVDGTLTWQPAVRYMNREDSAGAWADLWSAQSPNANIRTNSGSLGITPGANMLAQVGIKVTSTTARGEFDVLVAGS